MNTTQTTSRTVPAQYGVVLALAQLFERMDNSPVPGDPEQYRLVARRLAQALGEVEPGAPLQAVLDAYPSAGDIYENLHYQHAGLVRSPLEASLNAELQASQALTRAKGGPAKTPRV